LSTAGPIQIAVTIEQAHALVARARAQGLTVGLVPTMGALHEGHASLIRQARAENGFVVVSIFVNPIQFGPREDLQRYPRPFENDVDVCRREGADLVFHPAPAAMYPAGFCTYVDVHGLENVLEGASRPGHFRGVATVVLKLFNMVQPDVAYFGEKDAQQLRLIEKMVRDLDVPVTTRHCPTVREADGLALSSRNVFLTPAQRQAAPAIQQALDAAKRHIEGGERRAAELLRVVRERLATVPGARVDYVAVVDYDTLQPIEMLRGRVLLPVAVYFGMTRLIDNLLIDIAPAPLAG
jgi:pantoate--beta-alanine ligase